MTAQLAQSEAELVALNDSDAALRGHAALLEQNLSKLQAQLEQEREARRIADKAAATAESTATSLQVRLDELQGRFATISSELSGLQERERRQSAELMTARVAVEACNARLEAAARSNESLREDARAARAAERVAVETAAELKGMLRARQGSE